MPTPSTPATHKPRTRKRDRAVALLEDGRVVARIAKRVARPYQPLMAHVVVTRRCNLSCGYCFEYDKVSRPVPLETLEERVDHLARLNTLFVTLTGGEALLHPHIVDVVGHVRDRGMTAAMNTNGFLLSRTNIRGLNRAGLFALQLSIDNVRPNDVSKKSLDLLRPKLDLLARHAQFRVRVNTVLTPEAPDEAVAVARAITAYGFDAKCSLVRDAKGAVIPLDDDTRRAYDEIRGLDRSSSYLSEDFQLALARSGHVDWKCRAGARYFTVCEDGLVHLCESSYGYPGTPLADYGEDDIRRMFHMRKACATTCAVAYAHQASRVDALRPQAATATRIDKRSWMESASADTFVPATSLVRNRAIAA